MAFLDKAGLAKVWAKINDKFAKKPCAQEHEGFKKPNGRAFSFSNRGKDVPAIAAGAVCDNSLDLPR